MASGDGASARVFAIAGAQLQLQPDQAAADLGELELATNVGTTTAPPSCANDIAAEEGGGALPVPWRGAVLRRRGSCRAHLTSSCW